MVLILGLGSLLKVKEEKVQSVASLHTVVVYKPANPTQFCFGVTIHLSSTETIPLTF